MQSKITGKGKKNESLFERRKRIRRKRKRVNVVVNVTKEGLQHGRESATTLLPAYLCRRPVKTVIITIVLFVVLFITFSLLMNISEQSEFALIKESCQRISERHKFCFLCHRKNVTGVTNPKGDRESDNKQRKLKVGLYIPMSR